MELLVHTASPAYGNTLRQERIEPPDPIPFGPLKLSIEMHHLAAGMHAGIRASAAGERDRVVGDARHRLGEFTLDGVQPGLLLPAAEVRAVVLDA